MAMAQHTPAPWQVMNEYDGATTVIANVDGEMFSDGTSTFSYDFICDTLPDDGDGSRSRQIAKANARLIAAAPDMLEALKACHLELAWCKEQLAGEGYESHEGGSVCEALRIGKSAIAKAEGGAS